MVLKPNTNKSPQRYIIEARAYDIVRFAAHNFWVLRDEHGNVLGQMHGLATSPQKKIIPIGKMGDKLKFYHFGTYALQRSKQPEDSINFIKTNQKNQLAYSGESDEVINRWDLAVNALPLLNALEIPYTPFGIFGLNPINSNTAYAVLGKIMQIAIPKFPGYWQPGWNNANKILTLTQFQHKKD